MVQIGIIGFGKMGRIRAEAIAESGRGVVKRVYDPDLRGSPPGDSIVSSEDAIFDDAALDAVVICTPNHRNVELVLRGLESGKHVFCEKPPAFCAAEVERIQEVEAKSGRVLMYGFNHRHHGSIRHIKSMLDSGEAGRVLWMRGRYGKSVDESFYGDWRSKRSNAGGGILLDQGIHMLDLFLHLGGHFDEVKAFVSNLYWHLDIEDNVFAILRNSETNVVASLHSTMTQWRHLFSLEVFCERGYFVLNGLKTSSNSYGDEILSIAKDRTVAPEAKWKDEERVHFPTDKSWLSELNHFFDAVQDGSPVTLGSSEDALMLMRVLDKIYADDPPKTATQEMP